MLLTLGYFKPCYFLDRRIAAYIYQITGFKEVRIFECVSLNRVIGAYCFESVAQEECIEADFIPVLNDDLCENRPLLFLSKDSS